MKIVTTIEGQHSVITERLSQRKWRVTYGAQVRVFTTFLRALSEHESCVLHAAECAFMLT